jgi:hypothetical protein
MKQYITSDDKGRKYFASTIEGALSQAVLLIYIGDKSRHEARETLKQGKPYIATYGFKSVTIEAAA